MTEGASIILHKATASALRALVDHTTALRWEDLPQDIRAQAARIFCDDFAALVVVGQEPELVGLRASLIRSAGLPEASLLDGTRPALRTDRYTAALANGAAADWAELDGGHRAVLCHAALYCIPALLAEAEADGKSLQDLLLALVCGYETVARIAYAFSFPDLVLHPHGGLATLGTAAAVAKLRGLDADQTFAAITTAATLCLPGPFNHAVSGALIRNLWPGVCAQNGIRAVDWAPLGLTGSPWSLTEVFAAIFGAKTEPAALSQDLGTEWKIAGGYHKIHACCQYAHSTVEAVLQATGGCPFAARDVASIEVATHWKGRKLDRAQPETTLAAKFSIQHIAAASLLKGHAAAAAFDRDSLNDPDMCALRACVTINEWPEDLPWPNDRPAAIKIRLTSGEVLSGSCLSARGGPDQPFTPAEILEKIRVNLAAWPGAAAIMPQILALEPRYLAAPWAETLAQISAPSVRRA